MGANSLVPLALVALTVVAVAKSDAVVVSSASTGKIAFASDRAGSSDIYLMDADGGGLRRLTVSSSGAYSPAWSPDGARVAFVTDSGYPELQSAGAFASLHDENFDIYTISSDATGAQRLTSQTGDLDRRFCDDQLDPAWSPDGKKVAFASNHAGNFEIYVMNANGSGWQRLTRSRTLDVAPAWSPDGKQIGYARGFPGGQPRWSAPGGHSEIYVMNADGTGRRRLARNPRGDETSFGCANPPSLPRPAWSPDGRRIAFERFRGYETPRIYVINADGTGRRRLTTKDSTEPSWSPDGRNIAFSRYARGNSDIYVMNADGSGQQQLTRSRAEDVLPTWQPVPGSLFSVQTASTRRCGDVRVDRQLRRSSDGEFGAFKIRARHTSCRRARRLAARYVHDPSFPAEIGSWGCSNRTIDNQVVGVTCRLDDARVSFRDVVPSG